MKAEIAQFRQSPTNGLANARMGMAALAPQALVAAKEALSSDLSAEASAKAEA